MKSALKFNWNQQGMPAALVNHLGPRSELAEYKSVLHDAQDLVVSTADAEAMARELVQSGGREYVEMVRDLSSALSHAKKELATANLRYERLKAELSRRGIAVDEERLARTESEREGSGTAAQHPARESGAAAAGRSEWEAWNRLFQSLLG